MKRMNIKAIAVIQLPVRSMSVKKEMITMLKITCAIIAATRIM